MTDDAALWPADSVCRVNIARLTESGRNARTHSDAQVSKLAAAIERFGWTVPIIADEDNVVIAGHGRLAAARRLGLIDVPVAHVRGWTDEQRRAYAIADNRLAELAGWDTSLLANELQELAKLGEDLAALGFSVEELSTASPQQSAIENATDESDVDPHDAVPDIPPPVSVQGDVWLLGAHRLACGSSSDLALVREALGDAVCSAVVTSPPYAQQREYDGSVGSTSWHAMMTDVFDCVGRLVSHDAQMLINLGLVHREGEWLPYWDDWLRWMSDHGWRRFGWYVWDQGPGLPGDWNGRLAPSFEFIFHFNRTSRQANKIIPCRRAGHIQDKKGGLRGKDGEVGEWTHAGRGVQDMRIPDNVLRITRHKERGMETEHPAVFPVKLPRMLMETYTDPGDWVLEPFSGAGTTIIAAEQVGRRCVAIDMSPVYVDLAIARWMLHHPGQSVVHARTGDPFTGVAEARAKTVRAPSRRRRDRR